MGLGCELSFYVKYRGVRLGRIKIAFWHDRCNGVGVSNVFYFMFAVGPASLYEMGPFKTISE